jgi:hypothetical protein
VVYHAIKYFLKVKKGVNIDTWYNMDEFQNNYAK